MAAVRNRSGYGEDRFYRPPAMRVKTPPTASGRVEPGRVKTPPAGSGRVEPGRVKTPAAGSGRVEPGLTNLDRFLDHTTPHLTPHYFSKTSMRGWRTCENEIRPYFILGDLWESFKEWSAYGAGVPLALDDSNSVVQYYVPFLSGIQLYIDPSKTNLRLRRPGDESDADSSRETSSDGSGEYVNERGANNANGTWGQQSNMLPATRSFSRHSSKNMGSAVDETMIDNPPGLLIFEYLEHNTPYSREPLSDKIAVLASQFPELKTYRSCDLTSASWISVAWYPIYRIPTGPTLQNLDACFLTFHSLSTPFKSTNADWPHVYTPTTRDLHNNSMPLKLSLPIFGLASYKFKVSVWNSDGVLETQKANSLLHAADNWLRLLQVDHPDFKFFTSRNLFQR